MYTVKAQAEIVQTKGELLQIKALDRAEDKREVTRARTREELEFIAIKRGYSLRWVNVQLELREKWRR